MDLCFLKNLKIKLEPVVEKAGEIIMEVYDSDHAINEKSDGSPVTEASLGYPRRLTRERYFCCTKGFDVGSEGHGTRFFTIRTITVRRSAARFLPFFQSPNRMDVPNKSDFYLIFALIQSRDATSLTELPKPGCNFSDGS